MKNFVFIILLLCSMLSCVKGTGDVDYLEDLTIHSADLQKGDYSLSISDIEAFLKHTTTSTMTKAEDSYISAIEDENGSVVFYLVEFEEGWQLFASDMRVQPIVAECDKGRFDEILSDEGVSTWLEGMALDMTIVKQCSNDELKLSDEEIADNMSFWESVLSDDNYLYGLEHLTKVPPTIPPGNYVLVTSVTEREAYDSIAHLIQTDWCEGYPFNEYCPKESSTSTFHANAGTVAVAGAQMLYYLHYKDGVPSEAPSSACVYCTIYDGSDIYDNMDQYNWNSTIWSLMPTYQCSNTNAAPLVANIAKEVYTRFGMSYSSADASRLVDVFDERYSVCASEYEYSSNSIYFNLSNGYPIIASAASVRNGLFGNNYSGYYSFIIDSCIRCRYKTTNTYTWQYLDEDYQGELPSVPDEITTTYSSPFLSFIKMNWCRIGSGNDDVRFAPTDSWVYSSTSGDLAFDYDRTMILVDF